MKAEENKISVVWYDDFCASKNCKCFKVWDFGYGDCYSCTLIGESYNISQYPDNCLFLDEIKEFK